MTDHTLLVEKLREQGMDHNWTVSFVKELKEDEECFEVSDEKKRWALERGFFPGRIEIYGLTEENYHDYISDYQYAMMHPYNNHFLKWLDKLTLKYVLNSNGCAEIMPDYYVYVENELCGGHFTYLMNCPTDITRDKDFLLNLLKRQKILAMKPNSGTSGGYGFIKLEYKDGCIYENNESIDYPRFEQIRDIMRNYIITEYCRQHHELARIWPDSECTLRVIMCKEPSDDRYSPAKWTCALSYARFGTKIGHGASNLSSGGVGVGFDFETGALFGDAVQYKKFAGDGNWVKDCHPDTKVVWKDVVLPNWAYVRSKIDTLCQHISSLDYLGLDIIITEDGMKICEINSLPSLGFEQIIAGGILKTPKIREFFDKKGISSVDCNALYETYMSCQV